MEIFTRPSGRGDLERFENLVRKNQPFTFVRFSDGEIEILRNRRVIIENGVTEFRGMRFPNQFPEFDKKRFEPLQGQEIRRDLLESAIFRDSFYYKGIPTSHNSAVIDREFMLRLNGGFSAEMTFSDLFLNSNFLYSRNIFFPFLINSFDVLIVIGNHRCFLSGFLKNGELISIPDNFFSCYRETLKSVENQLRLVPKGALILSSASSLSNIIGYHLRLNRPDLTFLDIGTVLNDWLGLPLGTRAYHKLIEPRTLKEKWDAWRYRQSKEYQLIW